MRSYYLTKINCWGFFHMPDNYFCHHFHFSLQNWTRKTITTLVITYFYLGAYAQVDTIYTKRDIRVTKLIKEGFVSLNGKDGNTKNLQLAFSKFEEGANLGDDVCQLILATLYQKGIGAKPNWDLAKKWYTNSAENGNTTAILSLGTLYKLGAFGEVDFKKAAQWFQKGAELKNPNAMYAIGYMYMKGFGVQQDYCKAVEYLKKEL